MYTTECVTLCYLWPQNWLQDSCPFCSLLQVLVTPSAKANTRSDLGLLERLPLHRVRVQSSHKILHSACPVSVGQGLSAKLLGPRPRPRLFKIPGPSLVKGTTTTVLPAIEHASSHSSRDQGPRHALSISLLAALSRTIDNGVRHLTVPGRLPRPVLSGIFLCGAHARHQVRIILSPRRDIQALWRS
jgi:hypothetical protein